jgi:hypothetical protein
MGKRSAAICMLATLVLVTANTVQAGHGNRKVNACLKAKECKFIVHGVASEDPRMSFLVQEKIWKTFTHLDKYDLKRILKGKIGEAHEKPDKYTYASKKSPSYESLKKNVENMRSYSVILSYGKDTRGHLQLDQEILVNY